MSNDVINILDSSVIDKIAAGEVVERPASVIKELVENSIDASATAITVEIKEGGKKLIRVTDNGKGIVKSEVKKAFIRHATSKIKTEDDLNAILSLGFRGEALASIAAVSNVEMITKTINDITGKRMVLEGGDVKIDEEVGAPDGTTIVISDLFYNVPARRKFLKSDVSEASEIAEIVNKLALARPDISFKLINNNKTLLHTDGSGKIKNAIFSVYGKELVKEVLEVGDVRSEIKVNGYIGKPTIQRSTRIYETFFVNGRYIKSSILSEAVEEAYYGYVMKGKFSFCVLEIELEPELIDINVHPAKTEIRFKDENTIYETVKNIVREKLEEIDNTVVISLKTEKEENEERKKDYIDRLNENKKAKDAFEIENEKLINVKDNNKNDNENKNTNNKNDEYIYESLNEKIDSVNDNQLIVSDNKKEYDASNNSNEESYAKGEFETLEEIDDIKKEDTNEFLQGIFNVANLSDDVILNAIPDLNTEDIKAPEKTFKNDTYENEKLNTLPIRDYKLIGQLFNTYFLVEEGENFYLIDQHAAEEKVLYERLKKDYENKKINTQIILEPIIFNASPKEKEVIDKHIDMIRDFGFNIEEFGVDSYRITEVPYIFERVLTEEMFCEIVDELLDKKMAKELKTFDDMFATICCKKAIKGNDKQSLMEGKKLIEDLMSLDNPFNCPHGRPVIVSISKYEIERKFKRII